MQNPNLSQVALRFLNVMPYGVQLVPDCNLAGMIQRGFKSRDAKCYLTRIFRKLFFGVQRLFNKPTDLRPLVEPFFCLRPRLINVTSSRKGWARVLPADKSPARGNRPRGASRLDQKIN
jgi:hypothetical protein